MTFTSKLVGALLLTLSIGAQAAMSDLPAYKQRQIGFQMAECSLYMTIGISYEGGNSRFSRHRYATQVLPKYMAQMDWQETRQFSKKLSETKNKVVREINREFSKYANKREITNLWLNTHYEKMNSKCTRSLL